MDIPLNADVFCTDGPCGRSVCLVMNPITREITHVVVETKGFPHARYMVPLDHVTESSLQQIHVRCARHELADFDPFERTEFIQVDDPAYLAPPPYGVEFDADQFYRWPYLQARTGDWGMYASVEQIPPGELGVHRGCHVNAVDGRIGRVDEFIVNPVNNHITHLVLREGHLWGQKDVTIPVSEIDRLEENVVVLKLTKKQIQDMPAVPIAR